MNVLSTTHSIPNLFYPQIFYLQFIISPNILSLSHYIPKYSIPNSLYPQNLKLPNGDRMNWGYKIWG